MDILQKILYGFCCVVLTVVLTHMFCRNGLFDLDANFNIKYSVDFNSNVALLVDTPGCQIPGFDPFDGSVSGLFFITKGLSCYGPPQLIATNRTHLFVNQGIISTFNNESKPVCYYRRIWRKGNGRTDDEYEMENISHRIPDWIQVDSEFYYAQCTNEAGKILYQIYHPFIKVKTEVEERCEKNFNDWVSSDKAIRERLSVIFIGIDSVSRLNMLRHMPKIYNFLRKTALAIDLKGFNKVADNTFVNVVPMLSGNYVDESWNEFLFPVPLDYLNLTWKDFSRKGYRTFFAEDAPEISIFNLKKAGFHLQPTDYYLRPFNLATEYSEMRNESFPNCFGSVPEAKVTLDWLADFLETFQGKPTFSFLFNSRLTHNDLNNAGYADDIYHDFLQRIHSAGITNHSVLLFFSDHGIRFGKIRETYVGKLEERLPYFFLAFPLWFSQRYPLLWKNLRINEGRLTTPFDIYATLQDILNFTGDVPLADLSKRGLSLFAEIPPERTCEHATILPHWCTCYVKQLISSNNSYALMAAHHLVEDINARLQEYFRLCAKVTLERLLEARVSRIRDKILRFKDSRNDVIGRTVSFGKRTEGLSDYLLTIIVSPSGGIFEGTVRYFERFGKYTIQSDISRINTYGNQSACVNRTSLLKFCYCI